MVGVLSEAGSDCSPSGARGPAAAWPRGASSSAAAGVSHGVAMTRRGRSLGVAYGTASAADHHEKRARRLSEQRVLTQPHIAPGRAG